MTGHISKRARILGSVLEGAIVLGPTVVGEGSFVDTLTILGYPVRAKLMDLLQESGLTLSLVDTSSEGSSIGPGCIIRSGCIVYEKVRLAERVELGHGVLVRSGSHVEGGTKIGSFSQLDGSVSIGRNVNIQSGVYLPHLTKVFDDAFIGPGARATNDPYPVSKRLEGPIIGRRVVVGAGAVILPGVEVAEEAVVAAGAVVTKDVPPRAVVAGVPAKPVMTRNDYELKKLRYENP